MFDKLNRWLFGLPKPLLERINDQTVRLDLPAYQRLKELRLRYSQLDDQLSAIIDETAGILEFGQPKAVTLAAAMGVLDVTCDMDTALDDCRGLRQQDHPEASAAIVCRT
jgi:hypothetical protein